MPAEYDVRVVDRGAAAFLAVTRQPPIATEVGILGAAAQRAEGPEGVTVADVAEWAEFGIGQPMRSWLRGWIEENERELDRVVREELRAVLRGQRTSTQASQRLGAWIVGQIQARIARGIDPPNAQSTIDKKGSSTPLIDKGQFRSSITSRTVGR